MTPNRAPAPPSAADTRAVVRLAWADCLGHADFDDMTSFLHAGGHSLRAMKVMAQVSAALGVRLPVRLLLENPTIDGVSEAISLFLAR